jgi:hypothetical protein
LATTASFLSSVAKHKAKEKRETILLFSYTCSRRVDATLAVGAGKRDWEAGSSAVEKKCVFRKSNTFF